MSDDPSQPQDLQNQITETARKLGELVAKHPAIRKYAEAQEALSKDSDATRLLGDFERRAAVLMRNEQMGQVVGDTERRELEALQQQIASNLRVKAFSIAQTDMTDLLRRVSQTWQRPVAEAQGAGGDGSATAGPRGVVQ
jgi:cell fate (sporulation/competence/biofilm development) regulator YlbF (YheA/YmcA/DUF963 family)